MPGKGLDRRIGLPGLRTRPMSKVPSDGKPSFSVRMRMPGRTQSSGTAPTASPLDRRVHRVGIGAGIGDADTCGPFKRLQHHGCAIRSRHATPRAAARRADDAVARRGTHTSGSRRTGSSVVMSQPMVTSARSISPRLTRSNRRRCQAFDIDRHHADGCGRSARGFQAGTGRHNRRACRSARCR